MGDDIKNILPRERLIEDGPHALSEDELLAILLSTGNNNESVFALAKRIIKEVGGVSRLLYISVDDLMQISGIKKAKATKIIASMELSKRIFKGDETPLYFRSSEVIFSYIRYDFIGKTQEEAHVLFLDGKTRLLGRKLICIGGFQNVYIDIRALFTEALRRYAKAIVLIHNHPSGDPRPSEADRGVTRKIVAVGKLLGLPVIDHIIVGNESFYSFAEHNLCK